MRFEEIRVDHRPYMIKIAYTIICSNGSENEQSVSKLFKIGKTQFQFKITKHKDRYLYYTLFIKFYKHVDKDIEVDDKRAYILNLTSKTFNLDNKRIPCYYDKNSWYTASENINIASVNFNFDIKAHVTIGPIVNPLETIHDDTETADFDLCGEDGSVRVHKLVLSMCSPVLKTMLEGDWRESKEGRVDIAGTSQQTLQQLKDYIYLQKEPDANFDQLLAVASCYMMPDLEQLCAYKLTENITAENIWEIQEMVVKHKSNHLLVAFLQKMDDGKVTEIVNKLLEN